jgi:hypothetical protein
MHQMVMTKSGRSLLSLLGTIVLVAGLAVCFTCLGLAQNINASLNATVDSNTASTATIPAIQELRDATVTGSAASRGRLLARKIWTVAGGSGPQGTYNNGDVVYHKGSTYMSTSNWNASAPPSSDWMLLAAPATPVDVAQSAPPERPHWWDKLKAEPRIDTAPSTAPLPTSPQTGSQQPAASNIVTNESFDELPAAPVKAFKWIARKVHPATTRLAALPRLIKKNPEVDSPAVEPQGFAPLPITLPYSNASGAVPLAALVPKPEPSALDSWEQTTKVNSPVTIAASSRPDGLPVAVDIPDNTTQAKAAHDRHPHHSVNLFRQLARVFSHGSGSRENRHSTSAAAAALL